VATRPHVVSRGHTLGALSRQTPYPLEATIRRMAWVAVLALVLAPGTAQAQEVKAAVPHPMDEGPLEGERAAEVVGTNGYFAGGFVSGLALGLIGTGIAWTVAGSSEVAIP